MLRLGRNLSIIITILICVKCHLVSGDDFFQSLNVRLECYKTNQAGCNEDLSQALPEYSRSYDGSTAATTHFYLFTKNNKDDPELLHKCGGKLPPGSKFNPSCPTEIFIPGFVSGVCNLAIYRELKDQRLKCGCYNVILVDWMWGNSFDLYGAVQNMKIVAKQIIFVIRNLKQMEYLTADDFILTGHSLGAQICGLVGQEEPIGTINGIEPAGVLFTKNTPLDQRLDAGDAKCVQVMHCNGGPCFPYFFGVNFTCGTKDFWYNGGEYQPDCYRQTLIAFLKGDFIYALGSLYYPLCSHLQCLQYYKASICPTDCQFIGVRCKSYQDFQSGKCRSCGRTGQKCSVTGAYSCDCKTPVKRCRNYYLNTSPECPYCDNSDIQTCGFTCPDEKSYNY